MDTNNKDLKELIAINPILARVVDGEDLSAPDAEKTFTTIFAHDKIGFHLAIFIGAIHAKGETADELLGFYKCYNKLATHLTPKISISRTTDLSGTGGGSFKTINVSTASSFVVAAAGYNVAKASFYGVTSPTGSADVFDALGVDISTITKETVEKALLCRILAQSLRIVDVFRAKYLPRGKSGLEHPFILRQTHTLH